jgi:hypothetical protein
MSHYEPVLAPVYPSIGFEDLGRLLRDNGYDIEPVAEAPRPTYRALSAPQFTIELTTPFARRPGEYGLIHLWTRMRVARQVLTDLLPVMRLRSTFAFLFLDNRGSLVVSHQVVVTGGVTAYYLRDQFWYWSRNLERIRRLALSNWDGSGRQTLQ